MKNQAAVKLGRLGGKVTSEAKAAAVRENGKKGGRPASLQVLARLAYATHLCSWNNVHAEMKAAVTGLCRRGLMGRRGSDNALFLTSEGAEFLKRNGVPLNAAEEHTQGTAEALFPSAEFWTDAWGQRIPA